MAAFKVEIDSMEFRQNEHHNWDRFSKEFVFLVDEKKRIKEYVLGIKNAKLEQERKMRKELDLRLMSLKSQDREFHIFGKALLERIRFYIKAYYGKLTRSSNTKH